MVKKNFPTRRAGSLKDTELTAYLKDNADRQIEELIDWLRIPSVSTQSEHCEDMVRAAHWLANHLKVIGLENVEVKETDRHPLVYGEWLHAGDGCPTVLIYGHYDVQPVDPLDKWITPPFEPSIRGDDLFARGTTDDKGQLFALVKALQALLEVRGELPLNIKLIAEGDEESGAPTLESYVKKNRQKLATDVCLISDTSIISAVQPSLSYGLRGIWGCELVVRGPRGDLHSGVYGGVVHNPAQALAELLASMHDSGGRVAVPGFYDDVTGLHPSEREKLAQVPYREVEILEETGVPALYGEPGFSPIERIGARPTLEINGMWGGFTGEGYKTVIPAEARARISCRLVPDQDPVRIGRLVTAHLEQIAPPTVSIEVIPLFGIGAVLFDTETSAMQAAARAYESVFGAAPVFTREGGGIPIVSAFQHLLGAQVILLGFGLPDDNAHAPNEKIHLPNFYRGIRTAILFIEELAAGSKRKLGEN
jgi:acetylornithine deacetylase/succinyl-diaminopimelate desuccinylase-like protein